ncbi:NosD domain-containing protein [Denitrobaculum tricleocarpae]|uniref:Right-handed parallel beta-helix repeat-containing protein n=1 Tax=Denitrobaculum tricleocarpae TaxID=2591009 RepID=A0A545TG42_9PROT|nr:right-handed parallel beta-helix repeat-containing protein [Denitrobaculum tricleocarpae]TQV76200.1 right-handed parallel beta-helix repeat-containing protein [Denitrobaculum tricleocarpae]
MPRRAIRRLMSLCLVLTLTGVLGFGGFALVTQYYFQESAPTTWSRLLQPQLEWQREARPSLKPILDILAYFMVETDPRDQFGVLSRSSAPARPEDWNNDILGPQTPVGAFSRNGTETVFVTTAEEFKAAVKTARPGNVIQLQPGTYSFSGKSIVAGVPGTAGQPIIVRAAELGSVQLNFSLLEGFHVTAPFWIFENLMIDGVCETDARCEHAFHIVGGAVGTIVRNNWVTNFNAAIKVNGTGNQFPDDGLVASNAFFNDRPRQTSNPVTVLDIVAASNWVVRKNIISDFAKAEGDRISYGAFFKGAGENNVFEQNLVQCQQRHYGGTRIGFSFGGGGTTRSVCRDGACPIEHRNGIVRNNIIMNCPNDVGIYVNKSAKTLIHNNALINTRGIDIRFPESDAVIVNNILDGRILARDDANQLAKNNLQSAVEAAFLQKISFSFYADPQNGDFRLVNADGISGFGVPLANGGLDLCDQALNSEHPDIGPVQYSPNMSCIPVISP